MDCRWVGAAVVLGEGPFAARLRSLGLTVEVVEYAGRSSIAASARAVRRTLRGLRPRVVHANGFAAAAVAGLATVGSRIPVLWLKVDTAWDGWRSRLVARLCSEVVGMSETAVESLRGRAGVRVSVVEGGIPELETDAVHGRERLDAACGWDGDPFRIVLSGRLCPGKGQLELIEIAPRILASFPNARFALIGREDPAYPGYDRFLRGAMHRLGVERSVVLLHVDVADDAIEMCAGADVVVAPSVQGDSRWREGFGLVVVEAMQLGVPVAAYSSGSLPEVLGECGSLVSEGDRDALAGALLAFANDAEKRRAASECGRRRAQERYRIERAADQMCARYAAVASPAV
jgi:glycosyltransferase involved in cell wall biosynthesis